ncbi:hypothetical protein ACJ2CR_39725 [Myxococcus faecalis]|uniref:hypothetical protein n=1 Tax=Myxococcus faecalis TaxID=3115646 RepID=UPI0038CF3884
MKALWEATGWSTATGGGGTVPVSIRPEREAGLAVARPVFERWFDNARTRASWGLKADEGPPWSRLPRKLRIVYAFTSALAYADETSDAEDPPVFEVRPESPTPVMSCPSYVDAVVHATILRVMSLRRALVLPGPPLKGPAPFAPLFTGLWELGDGVWGLGHDPRHLHGKPPPPQALTNFVFRSFAHYVDFALSVPTEQLPTLGPPGSGFTFMTDGGKELEPEHPTLPGLRAFTSQSSPKEAPRHHAFGIIDGMHVWISRHPPSPTLSVLVEAQHGPQMLEWLKAHKARVRQKVAPNKDPWAGPPPEAPAPSTRAPRSKRPAKAPAVSEEALTIRQEATGLHQLLATRLKDFASSRRDVELGDKEPATLRAFWEPVGWSPLFAGFLGEPELAKGRKEVKRLLTEYRSWSDTFRLDLEDLPRQFRLAYEDPQGVGFAITDESTHPERPSMLGISADRGTLEPSPPDYLSWAGTQLLSLAFSDWLHTTWRSKPSPDQLPGATQPFPRLSPGTLQLTEDVWALPSEAWSQRPGERLVFRTFDALIHWMTHAQGLQSLSFEPLPGDSIPLRTSPGARELPATVKHLPGLEPGRSYRAGAWEDMNILLESKGATVRLATSPRDHERLSTLVKERGWR